ncbi:unnamed protein product [Calypogeia fissa]
MGLCFSSTKHVQGHEKPSRQVGFSAGLETLLRDADPQRSPQSAPIGFSGGLQSEALLRGANRQTSSTAAKTASFQKSVEGSKLSTFASSTPKSAADRKSSITPSTRISADKKLSSTSSTTRKSAIGTTRKSLDKRLSSASTRKSLVGINPMEKSCNPDAFGVHLNNLDVKNLEDMDTNEDRRVPGWQSLEHLLKETRESGVDGQKPITQSRYSPPRRPVVLPPSRKVHHGPVDLDGHNARVSPERRSVGRKSFERQLSAGRKTTLERKLSADRVSMERKLSATERNSMQRKATIDKKSVDRNSSMERKVTADRNTSMERKVTAADRNSVDHKPVHRKSLDKTLVDRRNSVDKKSVDGKHSVDRKSFDRKSFDRKSFDRKSVDRNSVGRRSASEKIPSRHSDSVPAPNMSSRRSFDRLMGDDSSPDHPTRSFKKTMARNGNFTPEANGNPKALNSSYSRQQYVRAVNVEGHQYKSSFTELDFLTQKFLIDNSEQTIQARIDHGGQHDHHPGADDCCSPRDIRSGHEVLDEFTKSCRESAARAAARDLDAFKTLSSIDTSTSDSSGISIMVSVY